jgi:hypothetical protein
MPDLTTDELVICHLIAQAMPLRATNDSCECLGMDTCAYCRFVAAGVVDHLADNGYRIARNDGSQEGA